ncbi:hypothetical protein Tco_0938516 [Tanacetum coccineum]|uniref:Uncharacterized protein n=1 Tax=Tanacetum coccineum TaxID=301880 RepID=A0ABQ5DHF1_9ASTR
MHKPWFWLLRFHSLILGFHWGKFAPEVAWIVPLKANYGICICPLGSWVVVVTVVVVAVVVVCSRRPAPTVALGQGTSCHSAMLDPGIVGSRLSTSVHLPTHALILLAPVMSMAIVAFRVEARAAKTALTTLVDHAVVGH